MTRLQYGYGIGIGLVALAIPILLFATPRAHVEKGDRVGRPARPHVVDVISLERPHASAPTPDPAPVSQNKTVENAAPPVEAEPPPLNEKDLLEPSQQTSAIEHHRRVEHRDICSHHGGHRVEFTRGRRLIWRCVYPRRH